MRKSKNTASKSSINAITKPHSGTNSGVRNKEKFALWAYPKTLDEISATYEQDNCKSKSEFIEKAVKFYLGYLKQERNVNYLSPMIISQMNAVIIGTEQRLNRNLFKWLLNLAKSLTP